MKQYSSERIGGGFPKCYCIGVFFLFRDTQGTHQVMHLGGAHIRIITKTQEVLLHYKLKLAITGLLDRATRQLAGEL